LPQDDPAANKARADATQQRDALREALAVKARALADILQQSATTSSSTAAAAATAAAVGTDVTSEKATAAADSSAGTASATAAATDAATDAATGTTITVSPEKAAFNAAFASLKQWDSTADNLKYAKLNLAHCASAGLQGSALKVLSAAIAAAPSSAKASSSSSSSAELSRTEALAQRAQLFEQLGWLHSVQYDKAWSVLSAPAKYTLF
jgi:trimeric autotransporter adhesin